MGLFQRLFTLSIGSKQNKEQKQNKKKKINLASQASQSTNNLLTTIHPNQPQAAVNHLLRSSSTHFSVLSETEYHSLPPIPHPINNFLPTPSIISTQTTSPINSYTVTIHQRTVHSRTEFPNANGTTNLLSTPSNSPQKSSHHGPMSPGDINRLETLRRDPSVLSLLSIFDDFGHPNPKAFANTPARQRASTFKTLLGEQEPAEESSMEKAAKDSDLSWAERCLQRARRSSSDSLSLLSSLGMADDLFKDDSISIRDADNLMNMSMTSECSSVVDSLEVELDTAENGSMVIRTPKSTFREDSLFQLLLEELEDENKTLEESVVLQGIPLKLPTALQVVPQPPRGPRAMGGPESKLHPRFTVRDGPQVKQTQLSPPPRKQQPQPLPPIPPDFQFRSAQRSKTNPLGYRAPVQVLQTNGLHATIVPSGMTSRSISVASSICPRIETAPPSVPSLPLEQDLVLDPYTPLPRRHSMTNPLIHDQTIPPRAPQRPIKSRVQKLSQGPHKCRRNNEFKGARPTRQTKVVEAKAEESDKENDDNLASRTPKKSIVSMLKTPERPSSVSSSELSPHGRRMMSAVRAQLRQTPRKCDPLANSLNTMRRSRHSVPTTFHYSFSP